MKIIFLLATQYFTRKYYDDFYIDKISRYYETEKWCLLRLNKDRYEKLQKMNFPDKLDDVTNIDTFVELEERLQALGERPIIITSYFNPKEHREIYGIIKKYDGIFIDLYKDGFFGYMRRRVDIISKDTSLITKIKRLLTSNLALRRVWWGLRNQNLQMDYCLTPPKLTFVPAKKFIPIHHIKYDSYLESIKENRIFDEKYAVFLDSNLPFLSDILITQGEESVSPEKYYRLLNVFFSYIEEKFRLKVVIAPHPKAEYHDLTFNRRPIIKYKTPNLVYNAEFVLTHDTTSNINAILSYKPLVFLYYKEMLIKGTRDIARSTIEYSKLLNATLLNLEGNLDFVPHVDKIKYQKFIDNFIVNSNEKDRTNEELIVEFLSSLGQKNL